MKQWFRKISVAFVAMITLGLYVPSTDITTEAENKNSSVSSSPNENEHVLVEEKDTSYEAIDEISHSIDPTIALTEKAKEQALKKLGPRIANQLDEEFQSVILPKIETELDVMFKEAGDSIKYYEITENPATGYGERIFNVYDHHSEKVIAKFHVRRDHRPLEGYWFNFHYHHWKDGFEKHYEIGNVYWDKNIPPKWMS